MKRKVIMKPDNLMNWSWPQISQLCITAFGTKYGIKTAENYYFGVVLGNNLRLAQGHAYVKAGLHNHPFLQHSINN